MTRQRGGVIIDLAAVRRARNERAFVPIMVARIEGGEVVLTFDNGARCRLTTGQVRIWRNSFETLLATLEAKR